MKCAHCIEIRDRLTDRASHYLQPIFDSRLLTSLYENSPFASSANFSTYLEKKMFICTYDHLARNLVLKGEGMSIILNMSHTKIVVNIGRL